MFQKIFDYLIVSLFCSLAMAIPFLIPLLMITMDNFLIVLLYCAINGGIFLFLIMTIKRYLDTGKLT